VRDEVDELVAFARLHGSRLEYPKISERYGDAIRGRLSTAEMWTAIGVDGEPEVLDAEFLGRYSLTPGLREFIVRARESDYRVAYLGDGPSAWATRLRTTFVLDGLVEPWVVSGEVGAALPEVALFEALRRLSAVDPANCLLIDDRLRVLEAAHDAGFGTAWFSPSGRSSEAPGHSIIRSFADLLSG
jgi:FMN phosphatase YigB (HAD superfamily)